MTQAQLSPKAKVAGASARLAASLPQPPDWPRQTPESPGWITRLCNRWRMGLAVRRIRRTAHPLSPEFRTGERKLRRELNRVTRRSRSTVRRARLLLYYVITRNFVVRHYRLLLTLAALATLATLTWIYWVELVATYESARQWLADTIARLTAPDGAAPGSLPWSDSPPF